MKVTQAKVGIKSQLSSRGGETKGQDGKLSQQLHKLQNKPTCSTRQTLCLWNVQKGSECSHRRKCSGSCRHGGMSHGSKAKSQRELSPQLVQRAALPTTGEPPREAEVGRGPQQGQEG